MLCLFPNYTVHDVSCIDNNFDIYNGLLFFCFMTCIEALYIVYFKTCKSAPVLKMIISQRRHLNNFAHFGIRNMKL